MHHETGAGLLMLEMNRFTRRPIRTLQVIFVIRLFPVALGHNGESTCGASFSPQEFAERCDVVQMLQVSNLALRQSARSQKGGLVNESESARVTGRGLESTSAILAIVMAVVAIICVAPVCMGAYLGDEEDDEEFMKGIANSKKGFDDGRQRGAFQLRPTHSGDQDAYASSPHETLPELPSWVVPEPRAGTSPLQEAKLGPPMTTAAPSMESQFEIPWENIARAPAEGRMRITGRLGNTVFTLAITETPDSRRCLACLNQNDEPRMLVITSPLSRATPSTMRVFVSGDTPYGTLEFEHPRRALLSCVEQPVMSIEVIDPRDLHIKTVGMDGRPLGYGVRHGEVWTLSVVPGEDPTLIVTCTLATVLLAPRGLRDGGSSDRGTMGSGLPASVASSSAGSDAVSV